MKKHRVYMPRTLKAAQRRFREAHNLLGKYDSMLGEARARENELRANLRIVALLAADGPAFDNPVAAMAAKMIRDRILADLGLTPNGKRMNK